MKRALLLASCLFWCPRTELLVGSNSTQCSAALLAASRKSSCMSALFFNVVVTPHWNIGKHKIGKEQQHQPQTCMVLSFGKVLHLLIIWECATVVARQFHLWKHNVWQCTFTHPLTPLFKLHHVCFLWCKNSIGGIGLQSILPLLLSECLRRAQGEALWFDTFQEVVLC